MNKASQILLGTNSLVLLVILPCIVSEKLIHPTETGKTLTLIVIVAILMAIIALPHLLDRDFNIRITHVDILLSILFIYIILNRYFIQESFGFSFRFYELIGLGVIYYACRRLERRYYKWLLTAMVLGGLLQAVYGNLQLYGFLSSYHTGFPLTGGFSNPGPYAGYLASILPIALGLYLHEKKLNGRRSWINIMMRYLSLITVSGVLLVLPATLSRAAWCSVLASSLFISGYHFRGKLNDLLDHNWKRITAVCSAVLFLSIGLYGVYTFKKDSADGRLLIWQVSWEMAKKSPFFGWGLDRFKAGYMEEQAAFFREYPNHPAQSLADNVVYAFNDPLQLIVEEGVIGFSIVLTLSILIVCVLLRVNNSVVWIACSGLFGLFVFGLFSYPSHILPIKVNGVVLLAIVSSYAGNIKMVNLDNYKKALNWGFGFSWFIISAMTAYITVQLYDGAIIWRRALSIYEMGGHHASLEDYKKAYPLFKTEGEFLLNYGKALSQSREHGNALITIETSKKYLANTITQTTLGNSYKALEMYEEAEIAYQVGVDMLPDRLYPRYLLAKLYEKSGQQEKLAEVARDLLVKKAKVESEAVNEIRREMRRILEGE